MIRKKIYNTRSSLEKENDRKFQEYLNSQKNRSFSRLQREELNYYENLQRHQSPIYTQSYYDTLSRIREADDFDFAHQLQAEIDAMSSGINFLYY